MKSYNQHKLIIDILKCPLKRNVHTLIEIVNYAINNNKIYEAMPVNWPVCFSFGKTTHVIKKIHIS